MLVAEPSRRHGAERQFLILGLMWDEWRALAVGAGRFSGGGMFRDIFG